MKTLSAARVLVVRGSVYANLNRYDESGPLFEQALEIRKNLLQDDDQLLANSYMQMGNFHMSQKEYSEAIAAHQKVIQIRQRSYESAPGQMIISYFNLARPLVVANRLEEAEAALRSAEACEVDLLSPNERAYYKWL